ncbi:unnamed protein product [Parnassius mnemosyne]|uniref:Uncharacterized protein n=1 Tax=Parnassius mnemosyne TaxID=213953 RepID=A0AAV1LQI3_9NEOP
MEAKYKTLNLKRASIRGRVTKFNNHLEELKGKKLTPTEVSVLSQRLVKLETLFGEFDSVQNQIEALEENNLSLELDTREVIEQAFHNSIALAQEIISSVQFDLSPPEYAKGINENRYDPNIICVCLINLPQKTVEHFGQACIKHIAN